MISIIDELNAMEAAAPGSSGVGARAARRAIDRSGPQRVDARRRDAEIDEAIDAVRKAVT